MVCLLDAGYGGMKSDSPFIHQGSSRTPESTVKAAQAVLFQPSGGSYLAASVAEQPI